MLKEREREKQLVLENTTALLNGRERVLNVYKARILQKPEVEDSKSETGDFESETEDLESKKEDWSTPIQRRPTPVVPRNNQQTGRGVKLLSP